MLTIIHEPCHEPFHEPIIYIGAWTAVPPASSWFNDGIRSIMVPHLPLPPPPAASPGAGTSGSANTLESNARDDSGLPDGVEVSIESLILHERVGEGTQSEVLLAELPGSGELVAEGMPARYAASVFVKKLIVNKSRL